jgi:hypothetical protein
MAYDASRGVLTLTERQFLAADVNGDGKITMLDVSMIYDASRGQLSFD